MLTPGRRACSAFGLLPQQESTAATHLQDLGLWQEGHVPLGLPHLLLCHANPKASPASAALSSVTSHTPMLQAMPQGSPKSDQGQQVATSRIHSAPQAANTALPASWADSDPPSANSNPTMQDRNVTAMLMTHCISSLGFGAREGTQRAAGRGEYAQRI